MATIKDIMTPGVMTLRAKATAADAVERLLAYHVGGAPVVDGGRVVGMVSKTDLLGVPDDTILESIMTPYLHYVRASDPAEIAVELMLADRIHRLVVLGPEGTAVGMVTTTDVMRAVQRGGGICLPDGWSHAEAAAALDAEDY